MINIWSIRNEKASFSGIITFIIAGNTVIPNSVITIKPRFPYDRPILASIGISSAPALFSMGMCPRQATLESSSSRNSPSKPFSPQSSRRFSRTSSNSDSYPLAASLTFRFGYPDVASSSLSRCILPRMAANNSFDIATSAIWKITYLA